VIFTAVFVEDFTVYNDDRRRGNILTCNANSSQILHASGSHRSLDCFHLKESSKCAGAVLILTPRENINFS
jgi:hypothetical protein